MLTAEGIFPLYCFILVLSSDYTLRAMAFINLVSSADSRISSAQSSAFYRFLQAHVQDGEHRSALTELARLYAVNVLTSEKSITAILKLQPRLQHRELLHAKSAFLESSKV